MTEPTREVCGKAGCGKLEIDVSQLPPETKTIRAEYHY